MGRPRKDYKTARNGSHLQFWKHGEYCGSLPLIYLCELAKAKRGLDTASVSSQEIPEGASHENRGSVTESHENPDTLS